MALQYYDSCISRLNHDEETASKMVMKMRFINYD